MSAHGRNTARRRLAPVALALLALPGVVHGCSSPTAPPPPPGGGSTATLSYEQYVAAVAPVIERHGCAAAGDCHGGGIRGTLQLSPADAKDLAYDFAQVSLQVTAAAPDASPILTEPLALDAGGTPHAIKPFTTTADSGYQAIHGWIVDGVTP